MSNNKQHIAILMGGWNSEKDVSKNSGDAVYEALIELGYKATKVNYDRNIAAVLSDLKPDVVFNALHGQYGEDGRVQGLLDIMQIPYTHSSLTASALCMDKVITRKICATVGIKSPEYHLIKRQDSLAHQKQIINKVGKPFVVKPISEGSSIGVEVVLSDMEFDIEQYAWQYGDEVLIEKYIAGQELNVAIVNDKAVGVIEVRPKGLFYDYESKYTSGMTEYVMPAQISEADYQKALDLGLRCHKVMGCRAVSRVEFILNNKDGGDGEIYLLEINTQPGLTALSLVPKVAQHNGVSFKELVQYLVDSAICG